MPQLEGAGVALHYEERGEGAAVLVIHAMAGDAAAWQARLEELAAAGARAVAYDRRGYGSSGAPQPYTATTVQEQSEDAAAVIRTLALAPALLVGEDFGALIALELLVRRPELARAAVLVDPPLYAYVPEATEALAAERFALEQALRAGGPAAAVQAWRAERGQSAAPEAVTQSHAGFLADYGGLASWSPSRRELRAIACPVAVLTTSATAPHTIAAADAATALLPAGRRLIDETVLSAALALLA